MNEEDLGAIVQYNNSEPMGDVHTRRACDSCYAHKAKCRWSSNSNTCDRCQRLSKHCVTERAVRHGGRKRQQPGPGHDTEVHSVPARKSAPSMPYDLSPFGVIGRKLLPIEQQMMVRFLEPSSVTQLMVAPRVGREMHREAAQIFLRAFDYVRDGFFSMYGAYASTIGIKLPDFDADANTRQGCVALRAFVEQPELEHSDLSLPWIWLGTSILIHTHCALGTNARPVRRYMLYRLSKLRNKRDLQLHPVVVTIIAHDIWDSLLCRERPILGIPDDNFTDIDTFLGIASPLIGFAFELANISSDENIASSKAFCKEKLLGLKDSIEDWQPIFDPSIINNLEAREATHVLTQIKVHKTMLLLYIHRLRFATGVEDAAAAVLSRNILSDLELATATSGSAPQSVTLPFIIAAIEVSDVRSRERILRDIPLYVDGISLRSHESAESFLSALWVARDHGTMFRWVDLIGELPPFCLNHVGLRVTP